MSQELADLGQCRASSHQIDRQGMSETMRSDRLHAGTTTGAADHVGDRHVAQGADRGGHTDEHLPARGSWPSPLEVGGDSLADIDRQRKTIEARPLAPNQQLSRAPVDVLQTQGGDLARPKTQADQEQQDGVVAPPNRPPPVARAQQGGDVPSAHPLRQPGGTPSRHRQRSRRQVGVGQALEVAEAQERAQRRDEVLGRSDRD